MKKSLGTLSWDPFKDIKALSAVAAIHIDMMVDIVREPTILYLVVGN